MKPKVDFNKISYLPQVMQELILCFTQQDLYELPWGINLTEYRFLEEVAKDIGEVKKEEINK